jgi:surfactin synthase thioesterase subunit
MAAHVAEDALWIRRFHRASQTSARLACFPHAGGAASFYFPISKLLSPAIEVLAIQYPGRQDRRQEPCIEDIGLLADEILTALRLWLDRPLALFGHSMGALLCFEVAQRLERKATGAPLVAVVSGRRAPSRPRAENVHQRDDDGVVAELRRLGGTDSKFLADQELLRASLPTIRSDYKATETYFHRQVPKLSCPITALVGDRDPNTTIDEARAWGEHTTGPFDLRVFPGGHFYLKDHQQDVIRLVAEQLLAARTT